MAISSGNTIEAAEVIAVAAKKVLNFSLYEGGGVLTTGAKGGMWFTDDANGPADWTIDYWVLYGWLDETGSVTVDIWVEDNIGSNGPPTNADSIVGGGTKPSLSSAKFGRSAPASWSTTTIQDGSILVPEIESISTFTALGIALELTANEP